MNFVFNREFHGTLRNNVALILDGSNMIMKPIDFFKVNSNDQALGVLLLS